MSVVTKDSNAPRLKFSFNPEGLLKTTIQPRARQLSMKASLYEFQKDCATWMESRRKIILSLEMGMGKTIMSINYIVTKNFYRTLVVVPNGLQDQWYTEFLKHSDINPSEIYKHDGSARHNKDYTGIRIVLITYAKLSYDHENIPSGTLFKDYIPLIDCLVCDESHVARKKKTIINGIITRIAFPTNSVLLLTGTPIVNGQEDFYSLLRILARSQMTDLKTIKDDVFYSKKFIDLPASSFRGNTLHQSTIICQMSSDHLTVYCRFLHKYFKALLDDTIANPAHKLTTICKLRQISNHPDCAGIKKKKDIVSNKFEIIYSLCNDILGRSDDEKILIFSEFNSTFRVLGEMFGDDNYITFNGLCNKKKVLEEFNDGQTRIMFVNIKAGGVGLNLQRANHSIFVEPPWNQAILDQAIARTNRIGQTRPVHIYILRVHASLETWITELQSEKRLASTKFNNDITYTVDKGHLKAILDKFIENNPSIRYGYKEILDEQIRLNRHDNINGRKYSALSSGTNTGHSISETCDYVCKFCNKEIYYGDMIFFDKDLDQYHMSCMAVESIEVDLEKDDIDTDFIEHHGYIAPEDDISFEDGNDITSGDNGYADDNNDNGEDMPPVYSARTVNGAIATIIRNTTATAEVVGEDPPKYF